MATPKKDNPETRGRKPSMTPEKILLLEQAFSLGCSDIEACLHANIGKTTLYDFQKEHPEFTERKEQLKEKLVLKARTVIAEALNKGDKDMAKWYVERKKKAEFSTRQEVTGEDGATLIPKIEILPVAVIDKNDESTN